MSAFARLTLFCLRHGREPDELLTRLGRWMDLVSEVRRAPNGVAALRRIWHYVLATNEAGKPEEIVERLLLVTGEEAKEEVVTAAELLIERGRQEGQCKMLLKQLGARFGALPGQVVAQVKAADLVQLDLWAERVLTASTLTDVLGEA